MLFPRGSDSARISSATDAVGMRQILRSHAKSRNKSFRTVTAISREHTNLHWKARCSADSVSCRYLKRYRMEDMTDDARDVKRGESFHDHGIRRVWLYNPWHFLQHLLLTISVKHYRCQKRKHVEPCVFKPRPMFH